MVFARLEEEQPELGESDGHKPLTTGFRPNRKVKVGDVKGHWVDLIVCEAGGRCSPILAALQKRGVIYRETRIELQ